jgi:hypothetical protein
VNLCNLRIDAFLDDPAPCGNFINLPARFPTTACYNDAMKVREIVKLIEADGWYQVKSKSVGRPWKPI